MMRQTVSVSSIRQANETRGLSEIEILVIVFGSFVMIYRRQVQGKFESPVLKTLFRFDQKLYVLNVVIAVERKGKVDMYHASLPRPRVADAQAEANVFQ